MPTPFLPPTDAAVVDPRTGYATRSWYTKFQFLDRAVRMSGIGYTPGAGGSVTQLTSKATGVTLNKATGQITLNNAALNLDIAVSFTLTNAALAAGDVLVLNHVSGGTAGAYLLNAQCAAGSAVITVTNISTGNLSEAIVIGFALLKGQTV